LLQITAKGAPSVLENKIKMQPHLERHIINGVFGDNKIYVPPTVDGYKEAFKKLGREGLRGLYKGNLTGVIMAASNSMIRGQLYSRAGDSGLLGEGINANLLSNCSA
jgi:hypothetical protein